MIKSITVTNEYSERLKLDIFHPEESGFIVTGVTGIGPTKADINVTEMSSIDGAQFNSARIPNRNIVISLRYDYSGKKDIEDVRHDSYRFFPLKRKILLSFETDDRVAEIEGYVETNDPDIFSKEEGADVSIICPNPFFYSGGEDRTVVSTFSGVEGLFEFPFSNESLTENLIEFGRVEYKHEKIIKYDGDSEIGVMIYVHAAGIATNITIANLVTRETMKIDTDKIAAYTGYGLMAGDEIVISTSSGNKSITLIRSGERINILNCLDRQTNWFKLVKGINQFAYAAESGINNLQFRIENRVLYAGV